MVGLVLVFPKIAQLVEPAAPDVCQVALPDASETRVLPAPWVPSTNLKAGEVVELMCNLTVGVLVPIPIKPALFIIILSGTLLVVNRRLLSELLYRTLPRFGLAAVPNQILCSDAPLPKISIADEPLA